MVWMSGNEGAAPRARLSQRAAFAINSVAPGDARDAYFDAVTSASSFEALPAWVQQIITDSEATIVAFGGARR